MNVFLYEYSKINKNSIYPILVDDAESPSVLKCNERLHFIRIIM